MLVISITICSMRGGQLHQSLVSGKQKRRKKHCLRWR